MAPVCPSTLHWLLPPPADTKRLIAAADDLDALVRLSRHALDEAALGRLGARWAALRAPGGAPASLKSLSSVRLGVVGNGSTELIATALSATGLRHGLDVEVSVARFDEAAQIAYGADHSFAGVPLDFVLLALDFRALPWRNVACDDSADVLENCVSFVQRLAEGIRTQTGADVLLQNFALPPTSPQGSIERRLKGSLGWTLHRVNLALDDWHTPGVTVLDVCGLAAQVGTDRWFDPTLWNVAKLPFDPLFVPLYCDWVCRTLAALRGKSRRCLILDLDNTLWGGVIGDDGIAGIQIGQGNGTGEAHLALQALALELRSRGVVLAVASKNEEANARLPFQQHPDMLLREAHIAVFKANWRDKASNIREIADALSLGLESMVFVDDNPAERMQVRRELPEVAVPELPDDPARFASTLTAAGYFEAVRATAEDRHRADHYQRHVAVRTELLYSSDMAGYLASLQMTLSVDRIDAVGRARVAQLIGKSNQFNLTTRRYTETELAFIEADPGRIGLQLRLRDVHGDNGMISVLIVDRRPHDWEIDTWLMSCRVLGRMVEEAALQCLIDAATAAGAKRLIGRYIPTARNALVRDHYQKLGFTQRGDASDGTTAWVYELPGIERARLPMDVVRAF